jgi:hypothetical protein
MAKKSEINKSQAVREYLKANQMAKNQEVVDALAKNGITVSANYVGTIKASLLHASPPSRSSSSYQPTARNRQNRFSEF